MGNNDKHTSMQVGSDTWIVVTAGDYYTVGIKTDGTLWKWSSSSSGFGFIFISPIQNRNSEETSPQQVGSDTDWSMVTTGNNHTVGIKTDGELFVWNNNSNIGE